MFAVLIAFALGVAGGYGVLRFLGSGQDTVIVDAQRAADALERENDRLKGELETSQRALAEMKARWLKPLNFSGRSSCFARCRAAWHPPLSFQHILDSPACPQQ